MKIRDDVILLANLKAGYSSVYFFSQWSALEFWAYKKGIRLYILTKIEDLGPLIANLDPQVRLIFTHGGDGTNFHILNFLERNGRLKAAADPEEQLLMMPLGGGTMRRLSRFTRWVDEPVVNAKKALDFYDRHYRACLSLPLLSVKWGSESYVGVTCLTGAIVRVMQEYSRFQTTQLFALLMSATALGAGLVGWPPYLTRLYGQFEGVVTVDGRELADRQFIGTLADVMDTTIFHISPYRQKRGKGEFHCLAYAINHQELVRNFPRLAIGKPPRSPQYFNESVKELVVESAAPLDVTIDGEFFLVPPNTKLTVSLGPSVRLLVNPTLSIPLLSVLNTRLEALLDMHRFFWPGLKK